VITARAHAATAVLAATASVSACAASCFVARVRASREEKTASPIPPGREPRGWLHAGGFREKRPSSSTRQANKVGRMSRRASRI
jgi:hypothetical protein